jgi:hypothetical protein
MLSERDAHRQREEVATENLGGGDREVGPPAVVRLQQRVQRIDRRGHDEFRHVAERDEQVPGKQQRQVRHDRQRSALEIFAHGILGTMQAI